MFCFAEHLRNGGIEGFSQGNGHLGSSSETISRLPGNALQNDLYSLSRDLRINQLWRRWCTLNVLHQDGDSCIAMKRCGSRHDFIKNDAKRVEIASIVSRFSLRLFGRDVMGGA